MIIHFEITPYWLEVWAHRIAVLFYMVSAMLLQESRPSFLIPLIIGIILTAYGAHL